MAWADTRVRKTDVEYRLWVARRAPGGRFEPAVALAGPTALDPWSLQAGVSGNGDAFVLWTENRAERTHTARVAMAAAGAGPQVIELGEYPWPSQPALAVAPDGRALVALPGREALTVLERPPGGAFGASAAVAALPDRVGTRVSAALGPGGEAVVAWSGFALGGVGAVTRRAPGAFDPPRVLAPGQARPPYDPWLSSYGFELPVPAGGSDFGGAEPRATLTRDGRALVSWVSTRGGLEFADLAVVPLDGQPALARTARVAERFPQAVTALTLPDGAPAVAWLGGPLYRELWLAADGAGGGKEPKLPRMWVGAPVRRVLAPEESLVLPVRCDRECDVRGQIPSLGVDGSEWLQTAGKGRLELFANSLPIAPRRAGPVTVRLTYRAPGGRRLGRRTVTVRLVRTRTPPDPRAVGLRTERVGDAVRVRWRTDRPARSSVFYVTGAAERVLSGEPIAAQNVVAKDGARAFSVTLRPAAGIAWVTLHTRTRDTLGLRTQRVRVS